MTALAIAVGGGLGAVLRWWLSRFNGPWPRGTFVANMIGCLALVLVLAADPAGVLLAPQPLPAGIATGVLGGLTTFSTFAVEAVSPRRVRLGYVVATVLCGLALAWVGAHLHPPV